MFINILKRLGCVALVVTLITGIFMGILCVSKITSNRAYSVSAINQEAEYIFLDYIEATGTQYIDTGIKPTGNMRKTVTASYSKHDKSMQVLFGSKNEQMNIRSGGIGIDGVPTFFSIVSDLGWIEVTPVPAVNEKFITSIEIRNNSKYLLTHNGEENAGFYETGSVETDLTEYLFAMNLDGRPFEMTAARVYSFMIEDLTTNTVLQNLIPAKRISDEEVGMYDTVSKQFFTNQNTGSFEAGDVVVYKNGITYKYYENYKYKEDQSGEIGYPGYVVVGVDNNTTDAIVSSYVDDGVNGNHPVVAIQNINENEIYGLFENTNVINLKLANSIIVIDENLVSEKTKIAKIELPNNTNLIFESSVIKDNLSTEISFIVNDYDIREHIVTNTTAGLIEEQITVNFTPNIKYMNEETTKEINRAFFEGGVIGEYKMPSAPIKQGYDGSWVVAETGNAFNINDVITDENLPEVLNERLVLKPVYEPREYTLTINHTFIDPLLGEVDPQIETETINVKYTEEYTIEAKTKDGYSLLDGYESSLTGTMDKMDKTIELYYYADVELKIKHFLQNTNGTDIASLNKEVDFEENLELAEIVTMTFNEYNSKFGAGQEQAIPLYFDIIDGFDSWQYDAVASQEEGVILEISLYYNRLKYDIIYKNYDGVELQKNNIPYGVETSYTQSIPTKPADENNIFVFIGWDTEVISPIVGGAEYTAVFEGIAKINQIYQGENFVTLSYNVHPESSLEVSLTLSEGNYDYIVTLYDENDTEIVMPSDAVVTIKLEESCSDYIEVLVDDQVIESDKVDRQVSVTGKNIFSIRERTAEYRVEYLFQNLQDNEYTINSDLTQTNTGKIGYKAVTEKKEIENYEYKKTSENDIIAEDGSLVLMLYYDRELYEVTYVNDDGSSSETKSLKYQANPEDWAPSTTRPNTETSIYEFVNWTPAFAPVTEAVTYTANYIEKLILVKTEEGAEIEARLEIPEAKAVEMGTTLSVNKDADGLYTVIVLSKDGTDITDTISPNSLLKLNLPQELTDKNIEIKYTIDGEEKVENLSAMGGVLEVNLANYNSFTLREQEVGIIGGNEDMTMIYAIAGGVMLLIIILIALTSKKKTKTTKQVI